MITRFNKGDNIPPWVLRGPDAERQQCATFLIDVVITHGENYSGPVLVQPIEEIDLDQSWANIKGKIELGEIWDGAPTDFNRTPYTPPLHGVKQND